MSIHGIEVTATLTSGQITDEEAERVYLSLEGNFAIKSIDMTIDFDANTMGFLLGVESPEWTSDPEEFVKGVVGDALDKAFAGESGSSDLAPEFSEARVEAFA